MAQPGPPNHAHGNGAACEHCCHGAAAADSTPEVPEATEAEYNAALQEATQGLNCAIEQINDVLEEVKYTMVELQQEEEEEGA